jgi:hypothetical protein
MLGLAAPELTPAGLPPPETPPPIRSLPVDASRRSKVIRRRYMPLRQTD